MAAVTQLKPPHDSRVAYFEMPRLRTPHVQGIAPAARARSLTLQTAQKAKQAKLELLVIDSDEVVVRIQATPENGTDGPALADEVLAALAEITAEDTDHDDDTPDTGPTGVTATEEDRDGPRPATADDDERAKAETAVRSGAA